MRLLLCASAVLALLALALLVASSRVDATPRFCPVGQDTGTLPPGQQREFDGCMRRVTGHNTAVLDRRRRLHDAGVVAALGAAGCGVATLWIPRRKATGFAEPDHS